jgi:hypothetical protein
MMKGWVPFALTLAVLWSTFPATAETPDIPRLGVVQTGSPPDPLLDAFLRGWKKYD